MWTDTVYRVLAERIEALEAATEDRDTLRRDVDRLTLLARDRWDAIKAMQAERDDARKALAAMTAERDALLTTVDDRKDEAEKAWAATEEKRREVAQMRAERDALQAEPLHKPGVVELLREWVKDVNGVWHWGGTYTVGRSEERIPRWYATGPGMFAWSCGTADAALYELSTAYKDSTGTLSGKVNEGRAEEVMEIRSAWFAQSMKRLAETAASIQWAPYIERSEFQGACESAGMKPVDEDCENYRHGEWFAAWDKGEVMVGIVNDVGDPDRAGDFPPTTTHNTLDGLRARLVEVAATGQGVDRA